MDVSIVLVTSPFGSMPNTAIINYVIRSFDLIDGLENAPIKIIFDGCKVCSEDRFKKGRITAASMLLYDQYYENLKEEWKEYPNIELIRSPDHIGFAYCVKLGLERCTTTYALIAQHDRCFTLPFQHLHLLIESMEKYEYIRYIGFPTSKNITHDRVISCTYHLTCLNYNPTLKHTLIENYLYLQPLIFWFDSQHLCHRERYLKIYTPYKTLPTEYHEIFGLKAIKDMFLKQGDFIEDKFGQQQRNFFIYLKEKNYSNELIIKLFQWFGSYLCWMDHQVSFEETLQHELTAATTKIMVRHLHGRGFSLDRLKENVKLLGVNRIKNKSYVQIFQMGMNELADDENNNEEDDLGIKKDEVVVPLEKKLKSVEEDIDIGDLLFQQSEEDNDVDKKLYAEEEKDKKDIINNEHLNSTTNNVTI
eukprot:gene3409-3633_t